jgi:alpha-tubulin suppressor-like RCC1 family protein
VGSNIIGQLGNGSSRLSSDMRVAVSHLGGVTQVSAGFFHALALSSSGRAVAWGGQLLRAAGQHQRAGLQLCSGPGNGISGASAVSAGGMFSLALVTGGKVMDFGDNAQGQLGDGSTADSTALVQVTGVAGMAMISAGASHGFCLGCVKRGLGRSHRDPPVVGRPDLLRRLPSAHP